MRSRRLRIIILATLVAAPTLTLVGFGSLYLWQTGLGLWVGWPVTACLILAYFLGWRWTRDRSLLRHDDEVPLHWTVRDQEAWSRVEAVAKDVVQLKSEQLTGLPFYVETSQTLALELAKIYHPEASDPIGSLTLPEILTVVELAAADLRKMVDQYLPGGHLLTVNDMRRLRQLADWYPTVSNLTWLVSSIFAPLNTALRYLTVRAGTGKPWQMLQENVLVWFVTAFVHRLGAYLIELNSGRLRVGAERFQELQKENRPPSMPGPDVEDGGLPAAAPLVTIALVGQTKAGKSSLINALLGEQKALADVVTPTPGITRYDLQPPGVGSRLQLVDTVGYARGGLTGNDKRITEESARQADLILLVLHARNPAREADAVFLRELVRYFGERPELHRPAIVAVLTHIDLLSPSLEWAPPYQWDQPKRQKEKQIAEAIEEARRQLGEPVNGVLPICSAPGKVYGIEEWLMPVIIESLDQAHAVAFLRCVKAEQDARKIQKVFTQLLALAKGFGNILLDPPRKN